MNQTFRIARKSDIEQILKVRHSVKENILSNPHSVTNNDCLDYITNRGKGWVCEVDNQVVGFSIVDLKANNVWALFIHPDHEGKGIGKELHALMLDWYFNQTSEKISLSTAPGTRAEGFYRKFGWEEVTTLKNGEIKFEMSLSSWNN